MHERQVLALPKAAIHCLAFEWDAQLGKLAIQTVYQSFDVLNPALVLQHFEVALENHLIDQLRSLFDILIDLAIKSQVGLRYEGERTTTIFRRAIATTSSTTRIVLFGAS
jgi:hypothetical protein